MFSQKIIKQQQLVILLKFIEEYNKKFRDLDETITFRVLIQKPAEGTEIIPDASLLLAQQCNTG